LMLSTLNDVMLQIHWLRAGQGAHTRYRTNLVWQRAM